LYVFPFVKINLHRGFHNTVANQNMRLNPIIYDCILMDLF